VHCIIVEAGDDSLQQKKIILIICGDGTVVNGAMWKSIEPYSFTLGIF